MGFGVLVGVPLSCPEHVTLRLEECLRGVLNNIDTFRVVRDVVSYLQAIQENKEDYKVSIAVDALGKDTMYVPFLQGVQKQHPQLKIIVIVPNERKGSSAMEDLIDMGLFNAIFQSDIGPDNLRNLIVAPRDITDAAQYYEVDLFAGADEHKLIKYGYRGKNQEVREQKKGPVTRQIRDNVTVTRGIAKDFGKGNSFTSGSADEELFSFMDEEGLGINHTGMGKTRHMDFALEAEWVDAYKQELNKHFRDRGLADLQAFENGSCSEEEFRILLFKKLKELRVPEDKQEAVAESFMRDITSYGKLDVVLNTPGISDVKLNSKDSITIQFKGEWFDTNVKFKTDEEFLYFVNKVCTKNHVAVNINATQVVFSDIKTNKDARFRISVSHKSINTSGLTTASIRKIDKSKKLAHELIREGYWTKEEAALLVNAIRKKKTIIFCGGSGSGKTVGLNCLLEYLADNITGICIQEAEELFAKGKNNLEFQHSIAAKGEGKVKVSLKDLATQGLLKNAQLFVIGEIKGNEAEDFFTAANTGAQCLCTTHANTAFDALERIADLARGAGYGQEQMLKMLARNVDFVVNMHKYKVRTIAGVVGWDDEQKEVVYDVYKFNK